MRELRQRCMDTAPLSLHTAWQYLHILLFPEKGMMGDYDFKTGMRSFVIRLLRKVMIGFQSKQKKAAPFETTFTDY